MEVPCYIDDLVEEISLVDVTLVESPEPLHKLKDLDACIFEEITDTWAYASPLGYEIRGMTVAPVNENLGTVPRYLDKERGIVDYNLPVGIRNTALHWFISDSFSSPVSYTIHRSEEVLFILIDKCGHSLSSFISVTNSD